MTSTPGPPVRLPSRARRPRWARRCRRSWPARWPARVSCWTWATGSAPGRIVRRVLDRAAPELLAELAAWPPTSAWARRTSAPRRCAAPSGGCRPRGCGGARSRRRASPGWRARAAPGRRTRGPGGATRRGRDGGGEVSSYLATRGGVDDAAERGERPDGYPIDYDRAALDGARRRRCARVATWSAPRPTSAAATGCARTAAPTGSAATRSCCGARPSWPRRCAAARGPAASCGGCGTPPTPPTGRPSTAWVAAHDAAHPPAPRDR